MYQNRNEIRKETRAFLVNTDLTDMVAVTLTMKQFIYPQNLDLIEASTNNRHFLNHLNRKVYKNTFKRFDKKLDVIPVLEYSHQDRLHTHLAIRNPYPDDTAKFTNLIKLCWGETRWGYSKTDIQYNANFGWINYITKLGPLDEVDWDNMHCVR